MLFLWILESDVFQKIPLVELRGWCPFRALKLALGFTVKRTDFTGIAEGSVNVSVINSTSEPSKFHLGAFYDGSNPLPTSDGVTILRVGVYPVIEQL